MIDKPESSGDRLRSARLQAGRSQGDLAKLVLGREPGGRDDG
jgi:hypothetical protein